MAKFDILDLNSELEIVKKDNWKAIATDFCLLSNIYIDEDEYSDIYEDGKILHYATWWVDGNLSTENAGINGRGIATMTYPRFLWNGCRPLTYYSLVMSECFSFEINSKGTQECIYGEYPQFLASSTDNNVLESLYNKGKLKKTGKTYTCSNENSTINEIGTTVYEEYEILGNKFIRLLSGRDSDCLLSNGKTIKKGQAYWIKVEPIKWLFDNTSDVLLSKYILFTGVPLANDRRFNGKFKNSILRKYLNTQFAKDIKTDMSKEISEEVIDDDRPKQKNSNFTDLNSWINWSNDNCIHPVIHMFMIGTDGEYVNRNIDWIDISNRLYKFKSITRLKDYLDEDIFMNLCEVYDSLNISVDNVLNNTVNEDIISNLSNVKKYLLVTLLTLIEEEDYKHVSNFIKDKLGNKYCIYYEKLCEQCFNKTDNKFITKVKSLFKKEV